MKKTIVNPHWINNARTVLSAEFHYEDGRKLQATISDISAGNADWDEIQRLFTADEIEANTRKQIERQARERAEKAARDEADKVRRINETLFQAKLEAFELDVIKNSTDRDTKARLRRSKSLLEIQAYTTKLILDAAAAPAPDTPTE